MKQQFRATVRDIPEDTDLKIDGHWDVFTSGMREMVGKRITLNKYKFDAINSDKRPVTNWYKAIENDYDGEGYNYHASWLKNIRKVSHG